MADIAKAGRWLDSERGIAMFPFRRPGGLSRLRTDSALTETWRTAAPYPRFRPRVLCSVAVALAASVSAAGPSKAVTWTVSPTGAGQFTTIQDAVNAASAGDTLQLLAGVYETTTARDMGGIIRKAVAWIDKSLHIFGDVTSIVRGDNGDETYGFWSDAIGPQTFEGMQVWNIGAAFRLVGIATVRRVLWDNLNNGVVLVGPNAAGQVVECSGTRTRRFGVAAIDRAQATVSGCDIASASFDAIAVWATDASSVTVMNARVRNATLTQVEFGSSGLVTSSSVIDLEGIGFWAAGQGTTLTIRASSITGKLPTQQFPRGLVSNLYAHVNAESLTVQQCHTSVAFMNRATGSVRDSNLAPWTSRSVTVTGYLNFPTTFDLTSNCWGTTDSTAISASIQDGYDDPTGNLTGWVQFMPVRQCTVPTAAESMGGLKARYRAGGNGP